jgi:UDP-N-acetylmuramoyl-L-alanyl-D-glutamate--2,6-diaminopimelate ligase
MSNSLLQLFAEVESLSSVPDVKVTGIVLDSREVEPGNLFIALLGGQVDGHIYIDDAIDRGAAAIVGTENPPEGMQNYIQVADARVALAGLSAAFYDHPSRNLSLVGITGTDGKTTTANMIFRILQESGIQSGMITTVNAQIGEEALDTGFHVTTPEAPDVHRYLALMESQGLTHAVLETTSHGLAQERVGAVEFDYSVVTNITHEHLDYHGTYEDYRAAKGRLFTVLAEDGVAILNRDDQSYEYLAEVSGGRQISYGRHPDADLRAENIRHSPIGLRFTAIGAGLNMEVECQLLGEFNVSNGLAALATTVFGMGLSPDLALAGIASLETVPGRMEVIDMGQRFTAIVDFAHTPNALENAVKTARLLTDKRVITVFGSAGLRDREKRRLMAESSVRLADLTVLTAEDPRTESLDEILSEMASGAQNQGGVEGENFWRVTDRGEAISFALDQAKEGDVVLVLGKGHEQSMCFEEIEYPWDDRTALEASLSAALELEGPEMPYLPTQTSA